MEIEAPRQKMRKGSNPLFQKGMPNPYKGIGRPRGKHNAATAKFIELKQMAAEHVGEAFNMLWTAMQRGEPWAHQIYFKELYTLPRNFDDKKVVIEKKEKTIDGQIKILTEVLTEFVEVTHDETLNRLKVLNGIKETNVLGEQTEEIRETRDSLIEKVNLIQKVVDLKKELEGKNE